MIKKLFIALSLAFVGISAMAQVKGEKAIGANISYSDQTSNVGIGVKGQYNFTDAIRGEASFDYFFENNCLSMWDINANVHYMFNVAEKVTVYPLAGFTYTNWKVKFLEDNSVTTGKFGVNLGAGAQFPLSDRVCLGVEAKYQLVSDMDGFIIGAGFTYKF